MLSHGCFFAIEPLFFSLKGSKIFAIFIDREEDFRVLQTNMIQPKAKIQSIRSTHFPTDLFIEFAFGRLGNKTIT
jgi:hypothetical protein